MKSEPEIKPLAIVALTAVLLALASGPAIAVAASGFVIYKTRQHYARKKSEESDGDPVD